MKKHLLFFFTILSTSFIQGQSLDENFQINGDAKLTATWFRSSNPKEVSELLYSGDKLSIKLGQVTTDVFVTHKSLGRRLAKYI